MSPPLRNKQYTYEELRSHPTLVAVGDDVYDLEHFAKVHPGGDEVLLFGGVDAMSYYKMIHPFHDEQRLMRTMAPFKVGTITKSDRASGCTDEQKYRFDSPFAKDLIAAVRKRMAGVDPYATPQYWTRLVLVIAALFACNYFFIFVQPTWWLAVLTGVVHLLVGVNVMHDANHWAISRRPWVNTLFGYTMDLMGDSRYLWIQDHSLSHHVFTNHVRCDNNASNAEPFVLFHPHPEDKLQRKWFHRFPVLTTFFGLHTVSFMLRFNFKALMELKKTPADVSSPYLAARRPLCLAIRIVNIFCYCILPFILHASTLGFWYVLGCLYLRDACASWAFGYVVIVSHNFEEVARHDSEHKADGEDWYRMQVETTSNHGGLLTAYIIGSMNYQIEHHLFPRICSLHYPFIAPVVEEVCKKHGVRYKRFNNYLENLFSFHQLLRNSAKGIAPKLD
jgi:fatty acid desaturase (delta-4 desaturase)